VPLPAPLAPELIVSHEAFVVAIQLQPAAAVTLMLLVPPVSVNIALVGVTLKLHTVSVCSARATFKRPFDATTPVHCGSTSTLFMSVAFRESALRLGSCAERSAAAPATIGEAIEVPLKEP
jgi:hypothetical protein